MRKFPKSDLSNIHVVYLNQIMNSFENNDFKNIFRRSAGIPPAIVNLLRVEPKGRIIIINNIINKLLTMNDSPKIQREIKVHILNTLKLIFQTSKLKFDIEPFIVKGFITAIKGFSSEDWSIRNSALMLFSAMCKRTIGTNKIGK